MPISLIGTPDPMPRHWGVIISTSNQTTTNSSTATWSLITPQTNEPVLPRRALYDDRTIPGEVEE